MKLLEYFSNLGNSDCKELQDKVNAMLDTQAVIEFEPNGNIITANNNFLSVTGYSLSEIAGHHHSMFVDVSHRNSSEYQLFWDGLRRGQNQDGEFKRYGKGGKTVWISAAYCPLRDDNGDVYKVIKFARDITAQKEQEETVIQNANYASALMDCQANVMLADKDLNIIYMNKTVTDMLRSRESEIAKALPGFKVDSLIGSNVDKFHAHPGHQRKMLESLSSVYKTDIKIQGLTFGLVATPWYNSAGVKLGTLVEWEDKTDRLARSAEQKRIAEENARVKQALDNVTGNVMIADKDNVIVYMNDSVQNMMRNAEADIRKDINGFNSANLIGQSMDVFHKNPAHQRRMIGELRSTTKSTAKVGGRTFTITANPIVADGERIGTVVEWVDRTDEVSIENEIDRMIDAAGVGDFSQQISLEGKTGFFANVSKGLNGLVGTVEVALNDVLRIIGAMARGDLSERMTRDYDGTFGMLKTDVNTMADKLTEVISQIRSSSESISSSANEISQGNLDLSQRTEEQASSLEETASSMEEMTSTVRQSAENALKANELSDEAQTKAKKGGEVVTNAMTAMEEIAKSSKKISDIIGVIDEIAFQTNLLALNAAVEAARAGEQGRGFAVVAGEVRNLAQRSAGAAKEIKDLIRDSAGKVQDGRDLVNASGETLEEIVDAVETMSIMMRDISAAAQEQTSGIEQVNTAVSQMDEMTQQNAALVEEASAAGQAMADQANNMNKIVEFFSTNGQRGAGFSASQPSNNFSYTQSSAPKPSAPASDEWEDF